MLQTQWGNRDVKVVNNQVTRTGEFARHVTGALQVTPEESEREQGNDDDEVVLNGDGYEVCYRGDEELDDWDGP